VELQTGETEPVSLKKKVKAVPKSVPTIDHFYIAVLIPPEAPTQVSLNHTVRAVPNGYLSVDQRSYILTVRPGETKSVILVEWEMLMQPVVLKPRYEGLKFVKEIKPLAEEDRKACIRAVGNYDYDHLDFERWLSKNGLLKGIVMFGEDLTFARKAYLAVCKEFQYVHTTTSEPGKATQIIALGKGDNVALNTVLITLLRASKIPARLIYKRVVSPKKDEPAVFAQTLFYVEQIGWITADPTPFVRGKNPTWSETNTNIFLAGFGIDDATNVITGIEGLNFSEIPCYGPRLLNLSSPTVMFGYKTLQDSFLLSEIHPAPKQ